jgi:hypothetical protein
MSDMTGSMFDTVNAHGSAVCTQAGGPPARGHRGPNQRSHKRPPLCIDAAVLGERGASSAISVRKHADHFPVLSTVFRCVCAVLQPWQRARRSVFAGARDGKCHTAAAPQWSVGTQRSAPENTLPVLLWWD